MELVLVQEQQVSLLLFLFPLAFPPLSLPERVPGHRNQTADPCRPLREPGLVLGLQNRTTYPCRLPGQAQGQERARRTRGQHLLQAPARRPGRSPAWVAGPRSLARGARWQGRVAACSLRVFTLSPISQQREVVEGHRPWAQSAASVYPSQCCVACQTTRGSKFSPHTIKLSLVPIVCRKSMASLKHHPCLC